MFSRFINRLSKISILIVLLTLISGSANAQSTSFKKSIILNNKVSILLPKDFKLMDAKTLAIKYPPGSKPSEVYTNEETTVNVVFKKTDQLLTEQNVFTQGKKMEQDLVDKGRIELIKTEQIKVNSNIHVFSFYSNAFDTKVYNVMFIFSYAGKMVVGSFNCIKALQSQWQAGAYEIIRSIKEI
jgi:hypothetical protein